MELEIFKLTHKKEIKANNLRILGEEFVKNNKNKGKLIINNKKYPLKVFISDYVLKERKIKMILRKDIYNKSCLFKNCDSLETVLELSDLNLEQNFENYNYNEFGFNERNIIEEKNLNKNLLNNLDEHSIYKNLSYDISEIKKGEEDLDNDVIYFINNKLKYLGYNYSILNQMFFNCKSLLSLQDISKWNTINIIDMSSMFYNCYSLSYLPNISK